MNEHLRQLESQLGIPVEEPAVDSNPTPVFFPSQDEAERVGSALRQPLAIDGLDFNSWLEQAEQRLQEGKANNERQHKLELKKLKRSVEAGTYAHHARNADILARQRGKTLEHIHAQALTQRRGLHIAEDAAAHWHESESVEVTQVESTNTGFPFDLDARLGL